MTFGYDAQPVFQDSVADIKDHARDLLGCLMEKREFRKDVSRIMSVDFPKE